MFAPFLCRAAVLAALAARCVSVLSGAEPFYRLESALTIPSASLPNWDYLTFDPSRDVLYIARRDDGILIYDTKAKKITGTIANTKGGNATTLVPEFDRGYVTTTDGSLTIFQLSTLKTLDRVKLGDDADNAFYDPVTKQLLVTADPAKPIRSAIAPFYPNKYFADTFTLLTYSRP